MKRRDFLSVSTGLVGLGVAGCTDFADSADFDAGLNDGDLPFDGARTDSGPAPEDSGPAPEDSGPAPEDSGPAPEDAGMDAGNDAPAAMCVSVTFMVGSDHMAPHAEGISFPAADVAAGVDVTYDIRGASAHPHTLLVTAADFATLSSGGAVTITSSNDNGHTHDVTLQCMS